MFPEDYEIERLIDGLIHILGVSASVVGVAVLLSIVIPTGDVRSIIVAAVYSAGLVVMMALSAANNLTARSDRKEIIRPYDHAAIFLMTAGTYTQKAK